MRGAIVTGAGTGIGAACAHRLARSGYGVVLSGRRRAPLEEVAAALDGSGVVVPGDVGDPEHGADLAAAARASFGGIDAVVLNAGVGESGRAGEETPQSWERTLRINLTGAFLVAHAAMAGLVERRGALVAVASVNGLRAGPGWASYCASKAGLVMLAQTIARDYGPQGVRANAVCPGWVRTPMGDDDMAALGQQHGTDVEGAYALAHADVPLRRAATADEIASVVGFLLSEAASYVTGAALPVDGGATVVDPSTAIWDRAGPVSS